MEIRKGYGAPSNDIYGNEDDLYIDLLTSETYRCLGTSNPGVDLGYVTVYKLEDNQYLWEPCAVGGSTGGSTEEWIGDGNTHIWITLHEGRTSPMLGVCPNGTVTVDWGDGTTPDVLTGTSTAAVRWTPTHNYAEPGDYAITLTVDGEMVLSGESAASCLLRHSSVNDDRNLAYVSAIRKCEIGNGVTSIGNYAFQCCYSLASVAIPDCVTNIGKQAFTACYSLTSIVIPDGVTSIGDYAFGACYSLASVVILGGVTNIGKQAFEHNESITAVVIPNTLTSIAAYTFNGCKSVRYYDFTKHTAVPTLSNASAFTKIATDCEIRVPATLYDEWIAATNWALYANYIKAI